MLRRLRSINTCRDRRSFRRNPRIRSSAIPRRMRAEAPFQHCSAPRLSPASNVSTAPVPRIEASAGILRACARVPVLTNHLAAPSAQTSVSGTLTKKVSRHEAVASRPPRMGPAASPDAPTEPQTASARLRDGPAGKVVPSRPSTAGCSSAAAKPCVPRAASRIAPSCAAPPTPLVTPKSTIAMMNTRFAPTLSARRPPTIKRPAKRTAYALITHCVTAESKRRSWAILGNAT